ncbi:uncharacterized protein LOC141499328 [Macrotis lagotis]|uniref:uncharacterized protein LOC141499328 n=1 Tax=Macrotis lagotis TaxID=92651 RepID=UPI003D695E13
METKKFQQKALKQTKQKKSKSAEYLMAKEDGATTEGIENPAFNISSTYLSAYQTSEEKVIKHDKPASTLAAHPQKLRLQACAEPRGNEYSRNYFDPLMDEEINPRQCRMGVSREVLQHIDEKLLYDELMKLLDEENKEDPQAGVMKEDILVSESTESTNKSFNFIKDVENEMIPPYVEQFERDAQANIILLGRSSVEQDSKNEEEEVLQESIQMSHPRAINQLMDISQKEIVATYVNPMDVSAESKKMMGPCCKDETSQEPHHIQILLKCLRGIKDKVPKGSYFLKISLLHQLENCALHWSKTEQPRNGTVPINHDGNFYDVEIYINQSLYMVLPSNDNVKPGMTLLFEFFLCSGIYVSIDRVVGWGVFPFCDKNFDIVEGKFKCPLLRGHYDQKLEHFGKIEALICSDLDHWLCNLYFQQNDLNAESLQGKSSSLKNMRESENEEYAQNISYLEELEKYRYSVCSSFVSQVTQLRRFFKQTYFLQVVILTELQVAQWQTQRFWCIILLLAFIWFVRLYIHYCSQWLFLQVISVPVTKFRFYLHTVELCYPSFLLRTGEELAMVLVGPLALNTLILLLAMIRWGCQQLFSSSPPFLSKLIIALGLWTVLDPLAVFVVDVILGRLASDGDIPVADAAKLYWNFVRTKQSGIPGAVITVLLYSLLFIISWAVLYLYCLRLQNDSWILDTYQRIHGDEGMFFIPYDLEMSNQELSYIVKKAKQWRGINGERRKVAVYDYIWRNHDSKSGVPSCDLQHQDKITACATGPEGTISHVSIYTTYPSGFQQLYRHFLRLPDGAIVEVGRRENLKRSMVYFPVYVYMPTCYM